MIVITSVPFGYGNLSNLESAFEAVKQGVTNIRDRRGADGKPRLHRRKSHRIDRRAQETGAVFIKHASELPALVNAKHDLMNCRKTGTKRSQVTQKK